MVKLKHKYIHVKANMRVLVCLCGTEGPSAWQWGVAVGPSTWQSGRGSVAVGAWQRGSRGVAVGRGSAHCHVAGATATPYCHARRCDCHATPCHAATPRLLCCHAPTATLPRPECHVEGATATPHCHTEGPSVPHRHTKTRPTCCP